jgi:hypothetical protein
MDIWNILGIIAIISLIIFFVRGKNAVWGTFTVGLFVATIAGLVNLFKGAGFNWSLAKKIVIISILLGIAFEIIGRLQKKSKNLSQ